MLWIYSGFHPIFIYISIKVQMFLTLWKPYVMFLLNFLALFLQSCGASYLSCGDVICGMSCLCSLNRASYGVVICGISIVCLATCTTIGIANGFTLPLIILCAVIYVFFYSFFIFKLEAPPSSILFFLIITLLGEFVVAFFLFSSVFCLSSLVLLTLVGSLCGISL